MAIKGKKKAQRRKKGTRRPAAAPKVQYSVHEHVPWHQTSGGRVGIAIGIVLLIAAIAWIVIAVTSEPEADVAAQDELNAYAAQLEVVLDTATTSGSAIAAAPTEADADGFDTLKKDAREWSEGFQSAQLTSSQQPAPEEMSRVGNLIDEALQLYVQSAETFRLAAGQEGDLAAQLLGARSRNGIWPPVSGSTRWASSTTRAPMSDSPPPASDHL